ncbi:MAG: putative oxidoreductase [Solirubrobacterales bacterium]|nr:putative oxidoreductase [Solirubrobacterales bacterium]
MSTLTAQHLVVGSGAGGALTAARLAEAGHDVLVLEEGPHVEASALEAFSLDQLGRQYRHGGISAALGRPPVAYAEGRCVGGGTEINSGLYHLAGPALLQEWRQGWRVADLDHATLRAFAREPEAALSVQRLSGPAPEASQVLARGADALGWAAMEVPRWFRYDVPGGAGVRQTMTRTYVPRALAAGARLRPDTRVQTLRVRRGRVVGAHATGPAGEPLTVRAEHVWVCGGAIATPALLQRSGMRRGPGRTFSLHPTVKVVARFDHPLDAALDVPVHQVKEFGPDLSFGGSASRPGYLALALADDWAARRALMDDPDKLAVYYAAIRPRSSSGSVRALPGLRDPVVSFRLTRADLALLAAGLRRLSHLLLAAGARAVYPALPGGGAVTSAEALAALPTVLPRATKLMTVHLCSSVPMGEDEDRCPADSYGRVRGVAGLRVNDASLLPSAPGINPQGTIMAVAARNCAQFLAEETR